METGDGITVPVPIDEDEEMLQDRSRPLPEPDGGALRPGRRRMWEQPEVVLKRGRDLEDDVTAEEEEFEGRVISREVMYVPPG
eukprot:2211324-Heterocapsa_arctica.AAC.1